MFPTGKILKSRNFIAFLLCLRFIYSCNIEEYIKEQVGATVSISADKEIQLSLRVTAEEYQRKGGTKLSCSLISCR